MLPLPQFSDSWLSGVVFTHGSGVHAYVRLFNRFDGSFILSENLAAFSCSPTGRGWLTDVAAGTLRETNIEEMRALANKVSVEGSAL